MSASVKQLLLFFVLVQSFPHFFCFSVIPLTATDRLYYSMRHKVGFAKYQHKEWLSAKMLLREANSNELHTETDSESSINCFVGSKAAVIRREPNFQIRYAEAEEIGDVGWLIADAFATIQSTAMTRQLHRWSIWLQVYVGMLNRIFASSFAQGLLLAERRHETPVVISHTVRARPHAVLLAVDGGSGVIGAAELCTRPCPVPAGRLATPAPFVCNLAVLPAHRGRGAARALLQACEAEAVRWGYEEVFLECACDNAAALRRVRRPRSRKSDSKACGSALLLSHSAAAAAAMAAGGGGRLYNKCDYICERVDPRHAAGRSCHLRRSLGPGAPAQGPSLLRVNPSPPAGPAGDRQEPPAVEFVGDEAAEPVGLGEKVWAVAAANAGLIGAAVAWILF